MDYLQDIIIKNHSFPKEQYFQVKHPKKQIVLHHTVSPVGVMGDISWWMRTEERVGTWCIIDDLGIVHRLFSSSAWAHHLYVSSPRNKIEKKFKKQNSILNKQSIGIEIDSIGGLKEVSIGTWIDAYGREYKGEIEFYPNGFRGYEAFGKYTDSQISTLYKLIKYLSQYYNIPLFYYPQMWDICCEALSGEPGIFTHVSYRTDKSDCHPQPNLIKMLKLL